MPMVTTSPSTRIHSCSSVYCSSVWSVMILLEWVRWCVVGRWSGVALVEGELDDGCRDARAPHVDVELGTRLGDRRCHEGHRHGVAERGRERAARDHADALRVGALAVEHLVVGAGG